MLVADITINRKRFVGEIRINNISELEPISDYLYEIVESPSINDRYERVHTYQGRIENWDRLNRTGLQLIMACLEDAGIEY